MYTASVYSATIRGGAYEHEPGQDLVGRRGRMGGLVCLEFSPWAVHHQQRALPGGAKRRTFSQGATLSAVRGAVDRDPLCSVGYSGASLRLDASHARPRTGHG